MKRKNRVCSVIALLAITLLVSTGCTGFGCLSCASTGCRGCLADCLECSGEFTDCTSVVCDAFMGEACSDSCYVVPCYMCADCLRSWSCDDCGVNAAILSSLDVIDSEEYSVDFSFKPELISNLYDYYKLTVTVRVIAKVDLKDVMVVFGVRDDNGNKINNVELFIASNIEAGDYNGEEASVTFTFRYAEDRVGVLNPDYKAEITDYRVYGRYE